MKAAILLLALLASCAHAPPVVDYDAQNILELCKAKCALKGKAAIAACEDATHYRCLCEQDGA